MLLPAPCTTRRPGRDLSAWMDDAATPEGVLRIGLAHGAIRDFSEDGHRLDVIAPDRPERAGLDYLGLGDWHGQMRVGQRCWYSGTPEPDRFKHGAPGSALLVSLAAAGAEPEVRSFPVASFEWRTIALDLLADAGPTRLLAERLPRGAEAGARCCCGSRPAGGPSSGACGPAADAHRRRARIRLCRARHRGARHRLRRRRSRPIDGAGALRQAADGCSPRAATNASRTRIASVATEALVRLIAYCGARAA